jgi:uncharacterized protein YgfB (UPF0149 family)
VQPLVFDPIVDSAIIGVIGVVIGIGGYAFQNWQVKKAERERAEFVIKRERYDEWIKTMIHGFHVVQTRKESTSIEFKEELDKANNMLLLYGSDDVVKALHEYYTVDENNGKALTRALQKIILAMRKDLIDTSLGESYMELLRAT